jgi:acyl carrier protein
MDDPQTAADTTERTLREVVERTVADLKADGPVALRVTQASALDRDLGLDSLARMELLLRIERAFHVDLPEDTLQRAETVGDLAAAIRRAAGRKGGREAVASAAAPLPGHEEAAAAVFPEEATTLLEALDWHVRAHPTRTHIVCVAEEQETTITYAELDTQSRTVAAGLQRAGLRPRECVSIMLPTSPQYFSTYVGILMAGGIPVPIYPPARASQLEDHVLRHAGILANAQATMLVTVPEARAVARLLQARVPGLHHVVTPQQLAEPDGAAAPVPVGASDIAFIQYTSGSTGNPKGVVLTHANLLANIGAMRRAVQATADDVFVSWLPLYHDMGLIGAFLAPMIVGFPLVVMSPLAFLSKPERWLRAIHRYRGTLSAGPNFAYELCLKRIEPAALEGLDLSSWRLAFNGAEAVSPDTVLEFQRRFARHGLRPDAVTPVYGLAESSVGLLFPPLGRGPRIDRIRREPFARGGRAIPAHADDATAQRFVACGRPLEGHEIRIVDDKGRDVGERVEGRLEFRGPSATQGYYRNPQATAQLFDDGWLDTGDRAYRAEGDVYLTGRVKDIVIRGGRNIHPAEIEESVGAVEGVRRGCVAVFGVTDVATGTERLVVLAETNTMDGTAREHLRQTVSQAVLDALGEPPDEIVLAPPHTVLKTSSGKVRRAACRQLFEQGRVGARARTARMQVVRLAAGAIVVRVREAIAVAGRRLYGVYVMLLLGLLGVPTWLATMATPTPAAAWRVGRAAGRLLLRLAAIPLVVRGLENLPRRPCVLVSNHASYLDGMILVAALPRDFAFVAKRELRDQFVAGYYLARLGAEFVERFDRKRSVEDANRMLEAVTRGRSLIVFPEGTFVERPGLLPFHLGAFLSAAGAGVPVVPVSIRGSRTVLPAGTWWPRRATLEVTVDPPLPPPQGPKSELFASAVSLRQSARAAIARHVGEGPG